MAARYGRLFSAPQLQMALQSGGDVRIKKVPGRCSLCRVVDVVLLSTLSDDERDEWAGYAYEHILKAQWYGLVGDDTHLFERGQWPLGKYYRCKGLPEVVLRNTVSEIGDMAIEGIITVWPGADVQQREVRMACVFLHARIDCCCCTGGRAWHAGCVCHLQPRET